ncbi:MAG TPA: hypothetical protein VIM02_09380 [Rhizomicrobium sp.]|jgi:hypothetical protein
MAVATIKGKIERICSNKGNVRLFGVVSVLWIAATILILWKPLPAAPTSPDSMGIPRVVACADVVLDYDKCAAQENFKAATAAIVARAGIVLFVPLILPLLVIFAALVLEWVREGYRASRLPGP